MSTIRSQLRLDSKGSNGRKKLNSKDNMRESWKMKNTKKEDKIIIKETIIISLAKETMKMKKEAHPQKLVMAIFKVRNLFYLA